MRAIQYSYVFEIQEGDISDNEWDVQPGQGYSIVIKTEVDSIIYLIGNELIVAGRRMVFGIKIKEDLNMASANLFTVGCFENGISFGYKVDYSFYDFHNFSTEKVQEYDCSS